MRISLDPLYRLQISRALSSVAELSFDTSVFDCFLLPLVVRSVNSVLIVLAHLSLFLRKKHDTVAYVSRSLTLFSGSQHL